MRIRPGNAGRIIMMRINDTTFSTKPAILKGRLKNSASSGLVTEMCSSLLGPSDMTALVLSTDASTPSDATTSMAV